MATRREELLAALKTRLASITTANGYAISVNKVTRGLVHPDKLNASEMPALYIAGANETRKNITHTNYNSRMEVVVVGYINNGESQEKLQQDLNALIGAVTESLFKDPKFNDLAIWSDLISVETDDSFFSPKAVCEMTIEIQYVRPGLTP